MGRPAGWERWVPSHAKTSARQLEDGGGARADLEDTIQ